MRRTLITVFIFCCFLSGNLIAQNPEQMLSQTQQANSNDWREFRGEHGNGSSNSLTIPLKWTADTLKWKTDLPGRGWSSPVVTGEQIWLTTAIEEMGSASPEQDGRQRYERVNLRAICINRDNGRIIHDIELFQKESPPALHARNSFASPTPVIENDTVICSFGTMGTAAINRLTGSVIWRNESLVFDHETGPGSSPTVSGKYVILNCDGTDRQFIVALDIATGEILWKTDRSGELHENGMMKKAFSTPSVVEDGQESKIVISAGANWVYGYDLSNGNELWKVAYGQLGFSNVPRPLIDGQRMYVCSGFMSPQLIAWEFKDGFSKSPERQWSVDRNVPTIPTPLIHDKKLFMVSDKGIATAVDLNDGSEIWRERLPGEYAASPILIGENLLFCNDNGLATWVAAAETFLILESNQMESPIMSTPAPFAEHLYLRTTATIHSFAQDAK